MEAKNESYNTRNTSSKDTIITMHDNDSNRTNYESVDGVVNVVAETC